MYKVVAANLQAFYIRFLRACLLEGLGDVWTSSPDLKDETQTNCVVFGGQVIATCYDEFDWKPATWNQMMVTDPAHPFSAPTVLVNEGLAYSREGLRQEGPAAPGIYAYQKWHSLEKLSGGHFGFVWVQQSGKYLWIDSTNAKREWAHETEPEAVHLKYNVPEGNVQVVKLRPLRDPTKDWRIL